LNDRRIIGNLQTRHIWTLILEKRTVPDYFTICRAKQNGQVSKCLLFSGHMAILFHLEIIFNSLSNNDLCQWPKMSKLKKAAILATGFD
jgi:hypothetical protein